MKKAITILITGLAIGCTLSVKKTTGETSIEISICEKNPETCKKLEELNDKI